MGLLAMAGMVSGLGEGIRETGKTAQAGFIQSGLQENINAFQLKKQQEQQAYDTGRVDREQAGANERQEIQSKTTIDAAKIGHPDRRKEEAVSNSLKALEGMSEQWHKQMDAKALFNILPTKDELDRITKIETMRDTIIGHTGDTDRQIEDFSHFNDKKAPPGVEDPYKKGGRGAASGAAEQKMKSDNTGSVLENLFAPRRLPTEAPQTQQEKAAFLRDARAAATEEGMELNSAAAAKLESRVPGLSETPMPPVKRLELPSGARRGSAILPPDPAVSLEPTPPAALPSRENETTRKMQELRDAGGKGLPSGVELIVPPTPAIDPVSLLNSAATSPTQTPAAALREVPKRDDVAGWDAWDARALAAQRDPSKMDIVLSREDEVRFQQDFPRLAKDMGWKQPPAKAREAWEAWKLRQDNQDGDAAALAVPTPATVEQATLPVVDPATSGLLNTATPKLEAQPAAMPRITLSRTKEAQFQQDYPAMAEQFGFEKNPDANTNFDVRAIWKAQPPEKRVDTVSEVRDTPTSAITDPEQDVPSLTPWVGAAARLGEPTENENTEAADLRRFEGFKAKPYYDRGGWAIGYGTQLDKNLSAAERNKLSITEEDAKAYAIMDLRRQRAELANYGWFNALSTEKQNGIAQLAYTMGVDGVLKFPKMIKALEAGDDAKVAAEIRNSDWYKQVKPTRGEFVIRQLQGN